MKRCAHIVFMLPAVLWSVFALSQDPQNKLDSALLLPDKVFKKLDHNAARLESTFDKKTAHYVKVLERQEHKLKRKLAKKDSLLAKELFTDAAVNYKKLQDKAGEIKGRLGGYSSRIDSMTTTFGFLKQKLPSLENDAWVQGLTNRYQTLQGQLEASRKMQEYIQARQKLLIAQFQKLGMVRQLRQYRKQVYYYQAEINSYKQLLQHPDQLEAKLLEVARKLPQFKEFFARNSMLASLFPSSNAPGSPMASLQGLQTRASVNQLLTSRFGSSAAAFSQMQGNMQAAQSQLSALKNKLASYQQGSYGNTDEGELPNFKPNAQKTKTFLQRLEYGANIQSQKARYLFPKTSDIGLSLGYKLNDNGAIGVGVSYKIGWGRGWDDVSITHQGVGLRSYVDWKVKGSIYVNGGYEQNYFQQIHSFSQLKGFSAWQSSGLIGLSKKYQVNKKVKGSMKLLWDFLSYQQVPRTQPVLFRIGYNLK